MRSNVKVGRGVISVRKSVVTTETKEQFTRRMIIKMARPVAPQTADPATVSVREHAIKMGWIKPVAAGA